MRGRTMGLAALAAAALAAPAGLAGAQEEVADALAADPVVDRGPAATLTAGQPSAGVGCRVRAVALFTRGTGAVAGQVRIGLYRAVPGAATGRRVALTSVRFARSARPTSIRLPVTYTGTRARRASVWFTVATAGYTPRAGARLVTLRAKSRGALIRCNLRRG